MARASDRRSGFGGVMEYRTASWMRVYWNKEGELLLRKRRVFVQRREFHDGTRRRFSRCCCCRSGRCAKRAARILRCSGFCLQFTRVSLRRGLGAQRPRRCASKTLHRAYRAGTRWVNDSGVDERGSRGLDGDGGSRGLRAGVCAGEFCRMRFPPGCCELHAAPTPALGPTLQPRLGVLLDSGDTVVY